MQIVAGTQRWTRWKTAAVLAAGLSGSIALLGDARMVGTPRPQQSGGAPATILWAWEEREDLRSLDPERTGVAFLAQRIFLGREVRLVTRHQGILIPPAVYAIAVTRLEVGPGFSDSEALRRQTADALLRAASLPGIRGVQVDFDATESQREFYAGVLRQLRAGLSPRRGLTITALLSWCSESDGWLHALPVDAAVPMYFRLGKHAGHWDVREPLCSGSAGVSTDEAASIPTLDPGTRMYLFAPRPWTREQLATLNRSGFPLHPGVAQ
jgi:hypothetical protein